MSETTFTTRDFESIRTDEAVQVIARPSLSYWQDAWVRLKDNRRALFSLYLIIALLAFTIAGPWIWTVDPQAQDLDQVRPRAGSRRRCHHRRTPYALERLHTAARNGVATRGTGDQPGGAADLGAHQRVREATAFIGTCSPSAKSAPSGCRCSTFSIRPTGHSKTAWT